MTKTTVGQGEGAAAAPMRIALRRSAIPLERFSVPSEGEAQQANNPVLPMTSNAPVPSCGGDDRGRASPHAVAPVWTIGCPGLDNWSTKALAPAPLPFLGGTLLRPTDHGVPVPLDDQRLGSRGQGMVTMD